MYLFVLILNNSFSISCRYLDHLFKFHTVCLNTTQENIWSVHIESFLSSICKISENVYVTEHHNGTIIVWEIHIEFISLNSYYTNIKTKCLQQRFMVSQKKFTYIK